MFLTVSITCQTSNWDCTSKKKEKKKTDQEHLSKIWVKAWKGSSKDVYAHREFTDPKWKTAVMKLEYIDNTNVKEKGAGKHEFFKEVKLYHTLLKTKLRTV